LGLIKGQAHILEVVVGVWTLGWGHRAVPCSHRACVVVDLHVGEGGK